MGKNVFKSANIGLSETKIVYFCYAQSVQMSRIPLVSFLAIIFCLSDTLGQDKNGDLPAVFQLINHEVLTNSQAYENLKTASALIGHRMSGTENGRKAEEYAYSQFKKYGYTGGYEPFELQAWGRDSLLLEIVPYNSDNFVPIKAVALAHSPLVSDISAGIVDVGNGLPSDFEKNKLAIRGKIALANLGLLNVAIGEKVSNLHRSEKTALAIKYGATGIIFINSAPGKILLTGTASVSGGLIPIPAVCIGNESGKHIRAWMKDEKLMAQISMRNHSAKVRARNVVAELPGTDYEKEKIVIGGHLDSWDLGQGTIDNGLGSFAVLEIARLFKALKIKTKRTIEFVLFMGEEQGLNGSKAMVEPLQKHRRKLNQFKYMVNLDMAGNVKGFNTYGRTEANSFFSKVGSLIQATDSTYTNEVVSQPELHSDHQPFMLEGIPVAAPISNMPASVYDCYHADCDKFNLLTKPYIDNTVRFTAMMLYALANTDTLPAERLTEEETKNFLIHYNLKEKLIIGKEWKFEK